MCLISKVTGRNLISSKELQHNIYNAVLLNNNNNNSNDNDDDEVVENDGCKYLGSWK